MSARKRTRPEGAAESRDGGRIIAQNKKARHRYHIIETVEAGLSLTGNEVKSLRQGGMSLAESYARVRGGEFFLVDCHIAPYESTGFDRPDPLRDRRLLLKHSEIRRLATRVLERGFTVVPLKAYFKGPWAKVELALARGKGFADKRAAIRKRQHGRDMARALSARGRRRGR